ncbi:hypothetical protein SAMN06298226_0247 [Nitrosovibrio sp. Nv4]|nr:hypothetical protein SAMN06298226_0247 [Nitrosovibrio sp. Nv4]
MGIRGMRQYIICPRSWSKVPDAWSELWFGTEVIENLVRLPENWKTWVKQAETLSSIAETTVIPDATAGNVGMI